jgi:hypothetical protein
MTQRRLRTCRVVARPRRPLATTNPAERLLSRTRQVKRNVSAGAAEK